jgi:hypothetical protein
MAAHAARSAHTAILAWQTTLVSAVVLMVTATTVGFIARSQADPLQWMYFAEAAISAVVALLLFRRPHVDERWSLVGFLAVALPILPIFWFAQTRAIASGPLWQPFIGRKLIILGLALLTPYSRGATVALLALFIAESLFIWIHLDLGNNPIAAAGGEPWVTLIYFGAATSLAMLRWRNRRLEELRRQAEMEAKTLEELRRVSIVVHDRVNTPLQSLGIGLALLHGQHPAEQPLLDRMGRSLRSLITLTKSLREVEITGLRAAQHEGARLEQLDEGRPSGPC